MVAERRDGALPSLEISVKKLKEVSIIPGEKQGPAAIKALQFHPDSSLLLTAGLDKTLRIFAADGDENPKVSSFHFKDFPILEASFLPGGDKILMTGEGWKMWGLDVTTGQPIQIRSISALKHRRYFGLAAGPEPSDNPGLKASKMFTVLADNGDCVLCDMTTFMPIRTLRMATPGVAAAFAPGRDALYTADAECNIYEWDLGTGRCRQRLKEPWATGITCLATAPATQRSSRPLLGVGTPSGNIDMFDVSGEKIPREPFKTIKNLTTSVSGIRFHSSGEICAGFSQEKKDALKLIHTSTMTVFKNWPMKEPLRRVSAHSFANSGGLMAIGTDAGRVLLYSLQHYEVGR
uniref:Anaphase-promoting complex subunit 4 WD40 domain-containing protein n=1 Tax=Alexandrium catenella TaxID=2925 RepID=A0A7S1LPX3_ALECA